MLTDILELEYTSDMAVSFRGDAPSDYVDPDLFLRANANARIYYNLSTNGWSTPTWNGYPAFPIEETILLGTIAKGTDQITLTFQLNMPPSRLANCSAVVAIYDTYGKMIGITKLPLTSGGTTVTLDSAGTPSSVTVFALTGEFAPLFPSSPTPIP